MNDMFQPRDTRDKIRIARSFDQAAASYDSHALLQRNVADTLLDAVEPQARVLRILDLGSGTGYCASKLRALFPRAEIVSLDIAESMLRTARGRDATGVGLEHFVCADAERLPFGSDCFDLVVSNLAIQWCGDYPRLFAELQRVCRPGACAYLSTFDPGTLREIDQAWRRVDAGEHVNRFTDTSDLRSLALGAGFTKASIRREKLIRHYPAFSALARELKGIGASSKNPDIGSGLGGRKKLGRVRTFFESGAIADQGIPVTYAVGYLMLGVASGGDDAKSGVRT